jgi:hypothetical protein
MGAVDEGRLFQDAVREAARKPYTGSPGGSAASEERVLGCPSSGKVIWAPQNEAAIGPVLSGTHHSLGA